jgi:hypothetical protein
VKRKKAFFVAFNSLASYKLIKERSKQEGDTVLPYRVLDDRVASSEKTHVAYC